jgi:hypothetical protein
MDHKSRYLRYVGVALGVLGLLIMLLHNYPDEWIFGGAVRAFYANFSTELIGIAITVLVIDCLHQHRQDDQLKRQLVREMCSTDNGIALRAVHELAAHSWLKDGSIRRAYLLNANLQGAFLHDADLRGAYLIGANLQGAYLIKTDLKGADLKRANLKDASLSGADLYGARWLSSAIFNQNTTLPDSTKWTFDTDIDRFTNSEHPDFWRSDDPTSPAYRGKDINRSSIPTHMGA